tara:strand:- start:219 stop:338 length:120 start_codon:yes stop_codon:yes gene_type:complete
MNIFYKKQEGVTADDDSSIEQKDDIKWEDWGGGMPVIGE